MANYVGSIKRAPLSHRPSHSSHSFSPPLFLLHWKSEWRRGERRHKSLRLDYYRIHLRDGVKWDGGGGGSGGGGGGGNGGRSYKFIRQVISDWRWIFTVLVGKRRPRLERSSCNWNWMEFNDTVLMRLRMRYAMVTSAGCFVRVWNKNMLTVCWRRNNSINSINSISGIWSMEVLRSYLEYLVRIRSSSVLWILTSSWNLIEVGFDSILIMSKHAILTKPKRWNNKHTRRVNARYVVTLRIRCISVT